MLRGLPGGRAEQAGAAGMLEAILAGLLQGLLEWLPVSSSGQLVLYYTRLLGVEPGEAVLEAYAAHLGTSLSGLAVAWREALDALRLGPWLRVVLVPTLAAAPVGYVILSGTPALPGEVLNLLLGLALIATGLLLRVTASGRGGGGWRRPWQLSTLELVAVGVVEGLAALPGLSRSGVTVTALTLLGVDPVDAVRASILLGVPVTLAAGLYAGAELPPRVAAVLAAASFASGLVGAKTMLGLASRLNRSLPLFLVALGLVVVALSLPPLLG